MPDAVFVLKIHNERYRVLVVAYIPPPEETKEADVAAFDIKVQEVSLYVPNAA